MSDEGPVRGAAGISSVEEYSRKLGSSMTFMEKRTRENIRREIVAGVEEQVRLAGGDFARVSASLDDPKWVGKQMVKIYGIGETGKAALAALTITFAVLSVPSAFVSDAALDTAVALLGFAALVAAVYYATTLVSWKFAAVLAAVAAAVRIALFLVPLGDLAPIDRASSGEVTLFMVATAMVVLVALLPALASRRGQD